jgi:integral membrane protein
MITSPGEKPLGKHNPLRQLMLASFLEASTFALLLFVAVPLKRLADQPVASSIMGPVHGLAYLYYMWTVFDTVTEGGWTRKEILRLVAVAFIPFGGFMNAGFLRRKAALGEPGAERLRAP